MRADPAQSVVRLPDADRLAAQVAADVVGILAGVQAAGRDPALVLTGGTVARKVHAALAGFPEAVDWARVDLWWGDERYVPADDPERNSGQAWEDMLSRLPVDPARVHAMPASDGEYVDVASAASAYAHDLRREVELKAPGQPWFDVLILGIGPDGHCASLFPGRPEVSASAHVVGVTDAPKPPPMRISLGMTTLRHADRVLFVAAGSEKAEAVAASVAGGDLQVTPAAGPRGLSSTAWYLDEEASRLLP
jgi:6-phosphogluconolactonase